MEELKRGKGARGFLRNLCFAAFGVTALLDIADPYDPVNLVFGALVGLVFGFIVRRFLSGIVGVMNRDLRESHGKHAASLAVGKGMTFLVPFAVMATLATFLLGWSVPGGFLSAGLMTAGIAGSMEIDRLKGKTNARNNLAASMVCGAFSALWTLGIGYAGMVPAYIDGGLQLLGSLIGNPLR